jgi:glycosyltransferase involved in cell wall biosynthesis
MIEVKGLHVLASAADAILAARPGAHIAIAGDGPQRPRIEAIVAKLARRERVHLVGALSRSEVAAFLADADLFVNPGVIDSGGRAEGLGITTIEAMASGLACVGSRAGGITETIIDGETGELVAPGDAPALANAVGRLVDDAALRKRLGERAREMARERFRWAVLAREVSAVYDELLTRRSR